MANPVKHGCFLFANLDIKEGYVNVYRTPQGTAYGLPWSSRDVAQRSSPRPASYLLHIKRKVEVK